MTNPNEKGYPITINTSIRSLFTLLILFFCTTVFAQSDLPSQHLRGIVVDQVLQTPVEGATVTIITDQKSVVTDAKGIFRFTQLPIGSKHLVISAIGYKEIVLDQVQLNSGKELVLNISLEQKVKTEDAVVIKTGSKKNRPLNEMSAVSARAFTVEETQRYAAAVNDPSRMATAFPGVVTADDGNNNIVIRGNAPTGLLWRMEGVDIPNPNHFSSAGSSGGGISILSAQLLSNSDFVTGAFAAEYGNALSGVFDLKLRKGNNEKREFTLQAGLLGLNAAAEGPLLPLYGGSYLVNYRYSTLELLNKIGVPMEGGATNFQDLSFNIHLPTKRKGNFTWFGFGGLSDQYQNPKMDSLKWESRSDRFKGGFVSNTGATGITHHIPIGNATSIRSALALSYNKIREDYRFLEDDYNLRTDHNEYYRTSRLTLTSTVHHRFSKRTVLKGGVIATHISFDYFRQSRENDHKPLEVEIDHKNRTQILQAFAQWQFRPTDQLTINAGGHYLQLLYNNTRSVEPRFSVKWQAGRKNSLAIGYGQHSQVQALGIYFARAIKDAGQVYSPNRNLGFTRSDHYIFSWQHVLAKGLALKAEVYYQRLHNVPVSIYDSSSFSVLNIENDYITEALVNKGKGRNYGVELSLEKYLDKGLYYTASTSIYQSKYTALDGVERDTRFNGNYTATLIAGKEFLSSDKLRTFGINIKTIYAGGLRTTPVDLEKSIQAGRPVYNDDKAFTLQNKSYFRTDLRLSLRWNRKHLTSTLSLDIQNVSNRLNVYGQWFDSEKNEIVTTYQVGLIPVLNYKVEF